MIMLRFAVVPDTEGQGLRIYTAINLLQKVVRMVAMADVVGM